MPDRDGTNILDIVLMASGEFALPALAELAKGRHRLIHVYSQPPRPAGRGQELRRTPVHEAADALGIPVSTPRTLKTSEAQAEFRALGADLAVVATYGLILPQPILDTPRLGCVNLHGSALPRWRGAAPIQRAIMAGDATTGVTIFQMDAGIDTGPVLAMETVPIEPADTSDIVHDRLARHAAALLPDVLDGLADGQLRAVRQSEDGACYADKIRKDEGRIDFAQPAVAVERRLRGLHPWPGAWTELAGNRLILLEATVTDAAGEPGTVVDTPLTVACGEGALRVTRVQRAGKRPMTTGELVRGFPIAVGARLG